MHTRRDGKVKFTSDLLVLLEYKIALLSRGRSLWDCLSENVQRFDTKYESNALYRLGT